MSREARLSVFVAGCVGSILRWVNGVYEMVAGGARFMRRTVFNIFAVLSALLFIWTLLLVDYSAAWDRRIEFQHDGARWEIACGHGRIWIGNGLQVRREKEVSEGAMQKAIQDYQQHRAEFAAKMHQAPTGSQAFRDAAAAWDHTDAEYEEARARAQPRDATELNERALNLTTLLATTSVLPVVWVAVWLARHRAARRELRHPVSLVAMLLLLISLAIFVATVRSYWVGATWASGTVQLPRRVEDARFPAEHFSWYGGRTITLSHGYIQIISTEFIWIAGEHYDRRRGHQRGGGLQFIDKGLLKRIAPDASHWAVPGIQFASWPFRVDAQGRNVAGFHLIILSTWLLLVLFMIFPLIWIRRRWRRLRAEGRLAGKQCVACGYSLSGNTSGVCPECGTAILIEGRGEAHAEIAENSKVNQD